MDWGSVADWFGAVGTIAAVIVALWQSLRIKHNIVFCFVKANEDMENNPKLKNYLYSLEIKNYGSKLENLLFTFEEGDELYKKGSKNEKEIILWPLGTNDHSHASRKQLSSSIRDTQWLVINYKEKRKLVFKDLNSKKKYEFIIRDINNIPSLKRIK